MEKLPGSIGRYKLEMLNDYSLIYDENLSFSNTIVKNIL